MSVVKRPTRKKNSASYNKALNEAFNRPRQEASNMPPATSASGTSHSIDHHEEKGGERQETQGVVAQRGADDRAGSVLLPPDPIQPASGETRDNGGGAGEPILSKPADLNSQWEAAKTERADAYENADALGVMPKITTGNEATDRASDRVANYLKINAEDLVHPDNFTRLFLKSPLYDCQAAVVRDMEFDDSVPGYGKVAVSACNEAGKTQNIVAPVNLWQMLLSPGSRCVVTAKQERQIAISLMDSMRLFKPVLGELMDDGAMEVKMRFGDIYSQMIGFTTNEESRFQSFHRRPGSELMITVDEAAEVDAQIFFAVDRCNPNRRLITSAPGLFPVGEFHTIMTTNPENYRRHIISAYQCPHIKPQRIEDAKRKYGEDSPKFRSMILGLVTEDSDDCIFSAAAVDRCMQTPPPWWEYASRKTVFIDWSTGGDEIVVAILIGNRVEIVDAFHADRTRMDADILIVNRVYDALKRHGMHLPGCNVWADDDGVGWQFNKELRRREVNVGLFRGGSNPMKEDYYENMITESWYDVANLVRRHKVILPNDPTLRHQLITRRKKLSDKNPNIGGMEGKKEMHSRGINSPDRADAVIGCIYLAGEIKEKPKEIQPGQVDLFMDKLNMLKFDIDNRSDLQKRLERIGANAGA